jgi:hypothetical protein
MRALSIAQAKEQGIDLLLYKKDHPAGDYKIFLEYKIWCKRLPAIHLLCHDIETKKPMSFTVFSQPQGKENTKHQNFYGAKDCKIDFGDEDVKNSDIFCIKIETNIDGKNQILEAIKLG